MGPLRIGGNSVYVNLVMPMSTASFAASAQSFLQDGSRILLTLAMALFMAYLLFLMSAVAISSVATRIRNRHQHEELHATVTSLPVQVEVGWGGRPVEAADERALSA
ncbi:hypothetical protein AS188_07780 [Kocuria flava]|nr:hypothetical protein AS188_07780 [Kocuria flava]